MEGVEFLELQHKTETSQVKKLLYTNTKNVRQINLSTPPGSLIEISFFDKLQTFSI